jgi:alkanesulfonate monooxygenase SsuD/methylene tetrahydromethanopterin reductase-like flavin-dependent oxidoreductase (luciferase family)
VIAYSMSTDLRPAPGTAATPAHYDRSIELISTADQLGYRSVWVSEQHGMEDGYMPSPIVFLAAVARETTDIRLATGVHLLTATHPRRVAEEAGVLDALSRGRFTLGVGAGGDHPHELPMFGRQRRDRARLMEEGLEFLRAALSTGMGPDGRPINVPTIQTPIPIVVGALAEAPVDRAARLANGHLAYCFTDPEETLSALWRDVVSPAMDRNGRTRDDFSLAINTLIWPSDDWEDDWVKHVGPAFRYQQKKYTEWAGGTEQDLPDLLTRASWDLGEVSKRMLVGPPGEIAERLSAIRRVYPFDEVVTWPALPGVPFDIAEKCLRTFATEVAPAIAGA